MFMIPALSNHIPPYILQSSGGGLNLKFEYFSCRMPNIRFIR